MRIFHGLAVSGALFLAPLSVALSAAQAATLVYTSTIDRQTTDIHSDSLVLSGFDSALGTLTGVQIDYGFGIDSGGYFINNGITNANFRFTANYDIDFTFAGPAEIAGVHSLSFTTGELQYSGLDVGDRVDFGPFAVADAQTINPLDIARFIDTDFSYMLDTWTGMTMVGGGGNIYQSLRTTGEGFAQVTYTYDAFDTPVVPEPASWAMLIAGFGLLGVAMRRQRHRRQARVIYA